MSKLILIFMLLTLICLFIIGFSLAEIASRKPYKEAKHNANISKLKEGENKR